MLIKSANDSCHFNRQDQLLPARNEKTVVSSTLLHIVKIIPKFDCQICLCYHVKLHVSCRNRKLLICSNISEAGPSKLAVSRAQPMLWPILGYRLQGPAAWCTDKLWQCVTLFLWLDCDSSGCFNKWLDCLQQRHRLPVSLCQRALAVKSLVALWQGRLSQCYWNSAAERHSRDPGLRGF